VPDRDRRELYEDISHQLEKREKVSTVAVTVSGHRQARKYRGNTKFRHLISVCLIIENPLLQ